MGEFEGGSCSQNRPRPCLASPPLASPGLPWPRWKGPPYPSLWVNTVPWIARLLFVLSWLGLTRKPL